MAVGKLKKNQFFRHHKGQKFWNHWVCKLFHVLLTFEFEPGYDFSKFKMAAPIWWM